MKKITVKAPSNIAFIKYWGQTKHNLHIPNNNNISMTLSNCFTTTTVERSTDIKKDEIKIFQNNKFVPLDKKNDKGVYAYDLILRLRKISGIKEKVKIYTKNSFPSDIGIASSASGFSALTTALLLAYEHDDLVKDKIELSRQVRMSGSASAARSTYGGFVELLAGENNFDSYAKQLADEKHWKLVDIIAIVSDEKKKVSSTEGHNIALSSPYYEARIEEMQDRIKKARTAIKKKDMKSLGPIIEEDCISMHVIMMTSNPPLFYWEPGTMSVIKQVMSMREEKNLQAYFTIDAGANVHVICEKKNAKKVESALKKNKFVQSTIYNEPAEGVKEIDEHLF